MTVLKKLNSRLSQLGVDSALTDKRVLRRVHLKMHFFEALMRDYGLAHDDCVSHSRDSH